MAEDNNRPNHDELRRRLRLLRAYIARLQDPELREVDTLLSVAEGELDRTVTEKSGERWPFNRSCRQACALEELCKDLGRGSEKLPDLLLAPAFKVICSVQQVNDEVNALTVKVWQWRCSQLGDRQMIPHSDVFNAGGRRAAASTPVR